MIMHDRMERMEKDMKERKYRAALVGVLVLVILCGAFLFIKNSGSGEIPSEGTLVKNCECGKDKMRAWA